jgi:hypothetical protein
MRQILLLSALLGLLVWSGCKREDCTNPTNPDCSNYCFDPTDLDCDGYDPGLAQRQVSAQWHSASLTLSSPL